MPANGVHELRKLQRYKQLDRPALAPFGQEMVDYYKQTVQQRQTKLSKIAQSWVQLIPESLNDHCALHGLSRGSLTVLVDSATHLYELKTLLLAGLENQLLLACKSAGLRKISLKPGRPSD